jgi:hypothetical protein
LTRYIYVSREPSDAAGLLETAFEKALLETTFEKAVQAEEIESKVDRAVKRGLLRRHLGVAWVGCGRQEHHHRE